MAAGDVTIFDEAILAIANGVHDFDTDVFKLAWINNATTPTAATVTPTYADFSAGEQTGGTFPTAGGEVITITASNTAGTTTVECTTDPSHAKNASNPTAVYWAILYNSSKTNQAVAFVEISATGADGTAGLISLTWGASLFTMTQA